MCCHVEKVGVEVQDEALAMTHNAVRETFLQDVQKKFSNSSGKKHQAGTGRDDMPVVQVPVPADGQCCWHAILAARSLSEYRRVPRWSSGYACNGRQVEQEVNSAKALLEQAVAQGDDSDLTIKSELMNSSLVDVLHLDWVGRALDLSIRCTVHENVP